MTDLLNPMRSVEIRMKSNCINMFTQTDRYSLHGLIHETGHSVCSHWDNICVCVYIYIYLLYIRCYVDNHSHFNRQQDAIYTYHNSSCCGCDGANTKNIHRKMVDRRNLSVPCTSNYHPHCFTLQCTEIHLKNVSSKIYNPRYLWTQLTSNNRPQRFNHQLYRAVLPSAACDETNKKIIS